MSAVFIFTQNNTMEIESLYQLFLQSNGVCTDTRTLQSNQLYFALKGDNFNGNKFALEAFKNGALACVVDEELGESHDKIIRVENALSALQELAKHHRLQFSIPIIVLTGSNGKTTTKELVAAVLEKKYNVHYTKGNFNNHIGIPLTLLQMQKDTEIAVIEMGANHQREIAAYCEYILPDFGLITNIGKAHLEGFGGEEGVLKGKTELYQYIGKKGGRIFVNDQCGKLTAKSSEFLQAENIIFYGKKATSFVNAENIESSSFLQLKYHDLIIKTQLAGGYNFDNVVAAICIGNFFGVKNNDIADALSSYEPTNNRSELKSDGKNTYILDAYNANPSSMIASLEAFEKPSYNNKIVIIGEMMELGEYSEQEHKAIADKVFAMQLEKKIFVGKQFEFLQSNSDVLFFESTDRLKEWLPSQNFTNKTILLKGSRKNKLESIVLLK
jgi:UDP-N-acetylmuramoyl-tripeptide--D-alanyl-D-alanine ligase